MRLRAWHRPRVQSRNSATQQASRATRPSGFTLLEVIVVIAILAIVASVAIPTVDLLQARARADATVAKMEVLRGALEEHFADRLVFPGTLDSLETLEYVASSFTEGDAFLDGWGNPYEYAAASDSATVTSLGADDLESANDLRITVDGTRFLMSRTRDDMETIHIALRNYELRRVADSLETLPAAWYEEDPTLSAIGILITGGYLPAEERYVSDAWGDAYAYTGSPADRVSSSHFGN